MTEVTLDTIRAGDTWKGIPSLGPVTFADELNPAPGVPYDYPLDKVTLRFQRDDTDVTGASFGSPATFAFPVAINDPNTWEFFVPAVAYRDFLLTVGEWHGELKVYATDGFKLTLCKFILPVE